MDISSALKIKANKIRSLLLINTKKEIQIKINNLKKQPLINSKSSQEVQENFKNQIKYPNITQEFSNTQENLVCFIRIDNIFQKNNYFYIGGLNNQFTSIKGSQEESLNKKNNDEKDKNFFLFTNYLNTSNNIRSPEIPATNREKEKIKESNGYETKSIIKGGYFHYSLKTSAESELYREEKENEEHNFYTTKKLFASSLAKVNDVYEFKNIKNEKISEEDERRKYIKKFRRFFFNNFKKKRIIKERKNEPKNEQLNYFKIDYKKSKSKNKKEKKNNENKRKITLFSPVIEKVKKNQVRKNTFKDNNKNLNNKKNNKVSSFFTFCYESGEKTIPLYNKKRELTQRKKTITKNMLKEKVKPFFKIYDNSLKKMRKTQSIKSNILSVFEKRNKNIKSVEKFSRKSKLINNYIMEEEKETEENKFCNNKKKFKHFLSKENRTKNNRD